MERNIFLQECFKIIQYLYQLKSTLNIYVALHRLILGNLIECQKKNIENGHCSINNNISIYRKVINKYISYILNQWPRDTSTYFTLASCLFQPVKLTKNIDLDKCKYSSNSIWFLFRIFIYRWKHGENIIFGADMSSSVHIDNRNKDILVLGAG